MSFDRSGSVAVAALAAALALGACSKPKEPAAPAGKEHPLENDGSAARGVTNVLDRVKVQTDLVSSRNAIKIFQAEHEGKLPASLDEAGIRGLHYPDDYRYDAASGTVKSETYPAL